MTSLGTCPERNQSLLFTFASPRTFACNPEITIPGAVVVPAVAGQRLLTQQQVPVRGVPAASSHTCAQCVGVRSFETAPSSSPARKEAAMGLVGKLSVLSDWVQA